VSPVVLLVPPGGCGLGEEDYVDERYENEDRHALIFGPFALTAR
jgi:hypothetical protein